MRTPRIAILVLFFTASVFLVCRSISSIRRSSPATTALPPKKSSFRPFFSFTAPLSIFPPSAAISLTDDNSTFFPARPAAFGPPLAVDGLSGRLWIGNGFVDDVPQDGEGEGELGCSDIPGWEAGKAKLSVTTARLGSAGSKPGILAAKRPKVDDPAADAALDRDPVQKKRADTQPNPENDGTDDYLHQGLQQTSHPYDEGPTSSGSSHSDIQSMQETAEITGKVVLLSRGGCGFLEKVKWAQRRGAVALIVGDNQKGGPLIQMFARGDVSNVTIPSVFTSRTSAHLLSSLMQSGAFDEDFVDENGDPMLTAQLSSKSGKPKDTKKTVVSAKHASKTTARTPASENTKPVLARKSWLSRFFQRGGSQGMSSETSRPPSSGRLEWDVIDDGSGKLAKNGLAKTKKAGAKGSVIKTSDDGFHIGVQDWRDPDLVESPSAGSQASSPRDSTDDRAQSSSSRSSTGKVGKAGRRPSADINGPKGGSITPGSGEYVPRAGGESASPTSVRSGTSSGSRRGYFSNIFAGAEEAGDEAGGASEGGSQRSSATTSAPGTPVPARNPTRDGLWVTITPTGSASPFFDTLLVLVVSPLITLTVVYALLILRVKIRMRKWRAPKSVVDQLPVRTYHTVAPSPTRSPRTPSPASSSPTTPLLQGPSQSSQAQSSTAADVSDPDDLLTVQDALQTTRPPSHEKNPRGVSSEWKKYMGRQVECVVCLEEYVDGVSKVMSLPCGHEFHVECM